MARVPKPKKSSAKVAEGYTHPDKTLAMRPEVGTQALVGLDLFDPTTMETDHRRGDDVPCWMLDADSNWGRSKSARL